MTLSLIGYLLKRSMDSPTKFVKEEVLKIENRELKFQLRDLQERYDSLLMKCKSYAGFLRIFNKLNTDESFDSNIESEENKESLEMKLSEIEEEYKRLTYEVMMLRTENMELKETIANHQSRKYGQCEVKQMLEIEEENAKLSSEVKTLKEENKILTENLANDRMRIKNNEQREVEPISAATAIKNIVESGDFGVNSSDHDVKKPAYPPPSLPPRQTKSLDIVKSSADFLSSPSSTSSSSISPLKKAPKTFQIHGAFGINSSYINGTFSHSAGMFRNGEPVYKKDEYSSVEIYYNFDIMKWVVEEDNYIIAATRNKCLNRLDVFSVQPIDACDGIWDIVVDRFGNVCTQIINIRPIMSIERKDFV